MNKKEFISYVHTKLDEFGVKFVIQEGKLLEGNYSGWFDSYSKELYLAGGFRDSFSILVHEYCHFLQWQKKPKFWAKYSPGHWRFFSWLDSQKPVSCKVLKNKKDAMTIEYDCDRMALKLIKTLKLEIDEEDYAKKSNAYILSYHLIGTYRRWPNLRVYEDRRISNYFPSKQIPYRQIMNENYLKDKLLTKLNKCFGIKQ